MTFKTILVYLNSAGTARQVARMGAELARLFGAHLIGLHVVPPVLVSAGFPVEMARQQRERQQAAQQVISREIAGVFTEETKTADVSHEWRNLEARRWAEAEVVMRHGRAADLVIASQPEKELDVMTGIEPIEEVMLGLGRPVLFVPSGGVDTFQFKRILVAWNASRGGRARRWQCPAADASGKQRTDTQHTIERVWEC